MNELLDFLDEINKEIFEETGDIRAEIFILKHKIRKLENELKDIFGDLLDKEDDEKLKKIHDYYAQIYLETENFIKELKGEKKKMIDFEILKLQMENERLNKMLQDKNTYIVEKHLTKDYAQWKYEHDKKNATS